MSPNLGRHSFDKVDNVKQVNTIDDVDEKEIVTQQESDISKYHLDSELAHRHRCDVAVINYIANQLNIKGTQHGNSIYYSLEQSYEIDEAVSDFLVDNIGLSRISEVVQSSPDNVLSQIKQHGLNIKEGIRLGEETYYSYQDAVDICKLFRAHPLYGKNDSKEDYSSKKRQQRAKGERRINSNSEEKIRKEDFAGAIGVDLGVFFNSIYSVYNGGWPPSEEERQIIEEFYTNHISLVDMAKRLNRSESYIKRKINNILPPYKRRGILYGYESFYDVQVYNEIAEDIERSKPNTSLPENAIAFYLYKAGLNIQQNISPEWMKSPITHHFLEIDIYIKSSNPSLPNIGIEYDGVRYHPNPSRDANKNLIAKKHNVEIIHIREAGSPELPSDIPCIIREKNGNKNDLQNCIKQLFVMLREKGLSLPDIEIDIRKDKKEIDAFMNSKIIKKLEDTTEEKVDDLAIA